MRIIKAKEKKERALGMSLGLKAYRSDSPKSALIRRRSRPGVHGSKRIRSISEYKIQLMEKQKIKLMYGLTEKQMSRIVKNAIKSLKPTTYEITMELERRLDNAVYRIGFAPSRTVARQLVVHGHIIVNGRKVKSPSFALKVGDEFGVRENSKKKGPFVDLENVLKSYQIPDWLNLDIKKMSGIIKKMPEDIVLPFDLGFVIDYYSR